MKVCFNGRFSAMDFSNASSNELRRWVRRFPYFVSWIAFYNFPLCASELCVLSGLNVLFSSISHSPWLSSGYPRFPLFVKASILKSNYIKNPSVAGSSVARLVLASVSLQETWFITLKSLRIRQGHAKLKCFKDCIWSDWHHILLTTHKSR